MVKKIASCRQCNAETKIAETQARATMVACGQCGQMLHNPWRQEAEGRAMPVREESRWMRILFSVFPTRVKLVFGITLAELLLGAGLCLAASAFVIKRFDLLG